MANTVAATISISYTATGILADPLPGVTTLSINVSGGNYVKDIMTVNNTDTTIPLGGLSSPFGVAVFKNMDPVISISIRVAAAGTKILRLLPGECWALRIDSGITAPVAIADSGSPLMYYAILPP